MHRDEGQSVQGAVNSPASLEEVDLFAPGAQEHWYHAYDLLHRFSPVHRLPGQGISPGTDGFILCKHKDIVRVVKDEARFPPLTSLVLKPLVESGAEPLSLRHLNSMMRSMITLRPNPELWRSHRQELTDPWIGQGAGRHQVAITEIAGSLIDSWAGRNLIDFVAEFARPLPQRVMATILGWPLEDIDLLKRYGDGTVRPFVYGSSHRCLLSEAETRQQKQLLDEFAAYTDRLIARKRDDPANDMISFLTQAEYSPLGRKLVDHEINGIVYAMVIGGLETTQYALAEQVQLLIEQPDIWQALKSDRTKIRAFIEEAMRLRSPTQGLSTRVTSQDEVFQGVRVPAGSLLHLRWAAANLDPEEWEQAQTLRLDRKAATRHLAFSQGPRVCPGASLSRLEQQIAWELLLARVERFTYHEDNDFLHQPGIMLGVLKLNLQLDS